MVDVRVSQKDQEEEPHFSSDDDGQSDNAMLYTTGNFGRQRDSRNQSSKSKKYQRPHTSHKKSKQEQDDNFVTAQPVINYDSYIEN